MKSDCLTVCNRIAVFPQYLCSRLVYSLNYSIQVFFRFNKMGFTWSPTCKKYRLQEN
ncbi:hypothetical protein XENTR_v10024532 [Xenopus tropicalis]|nr:hypothetical protein XENTR_v10024532 [Xenopus tropicalis]